MPSQTSKKNTSNRVSFRASDFVDNELSKRRFSKGIRSQEDLSRYYNLLSQGLNTIDLTLNEACLICDIYRGIFSDFQKPVASDLYATVYSVIKNPTLENFCDKWKVDEEKLYAKLLKYSALQAAAIIDATEQFWDTASQEAGSNSPETIAQIFRLTNLQ